MIGRIKGIFKAKTQKGPPPEDSFRRKYALFQQLLASNAENLDIIADIEEKLKGEKPFGMSYVKSVSARAVFHAHRMVKALHELSGGGYKGLFRVVDELSTKIGEELKALEPVRDGPLTLSYREVDRGKADLVGGKNANLGEAKNRLGLPVPEGFAVTTAAFQMFLTRNDLKDEIAKLLMELSPERVENLEAVSEEIQRRILLAQVPKEIEDALHREYELIAQGKRPRISMRSSATGEDSGGLSFAGQYLSSLNVPPERMIQTYKVIVGSLYTPRAIIYRLHKGIPDDDQAMAVACMEMVLAVASGVAYSSNPNDPEDQRVWISAVWGLGPYAVGGPITPDVYLVGRDKQTDIEVRISHKPVMLVCREEGGLQEVAVDPHMRDLPCLDEEKIMELTGYVRLLESHFGCPQDVEWALDPGGRIFILQCRPLNLKGQRWRLGVAAVPEGAELILEGGVTACEGVGFGPAFHVRSEEDLWKFPDGGVLVARQPSPKFMVALPKASAILTDYGSITGHMASLAREFSVPALLDLKEATLCIPHGLEVTVDATSGRVYRGRVEELLKGRPAPRKPMLDTPVYQVLWKVARWITPLNLVDPGREDFTPEGCRTIHDVMRLAHEASYLEMFRLSDKAAEAEGRAVRLKAPVPLDLYIIDLGGGLHDVRPGHREVGLDQIASFPLRALLKGMTHHGLRGLEPRPIELKGLLSVLTEQILTNPLAEERFGDKSYAIISDRYMNFSSRVGYHYGVLDTYCGQTLSKNYITFSFQGGAADPSRRNRRARAIGKVLLELGFSVDVVGDRTTARIQKRDRASLGEILDQIGRLLVFSRQMDMLMAEEEAVEQAVKCFLSGDYTLKGLLQKSRRV